jgi:2-amino-4-hydroxy-6-hydroxymethyldihydropteridine diphosphokinase
LHKSCIFDAYNLLMLHTAYLLLGSNRGDRFSILNQARQSIDDQAGKIRQVSSVYESVPWGFTDETMFLNQVVCIETKLTPQELLGVLMSIETKLGRIRHTDGYASRLIDIDILFFDNIILNEENLTIPHPRLHERMFTLLPLAELNEDLTHPVLQLTVRDLLRQCEDENDVRIFNIKTTSVKS